MTKRALIIVLAFLASASSRAVGNEDLYGTWRLLSRTVHGAATGEMGDSLGKAPHGFLSYARDGRMFAILTKDGRPMPTDMAKLTAGDRAELFSTMIAYAGTYTFDGKTVTHHVDISWNENWTGTNQVRNVRLEGGKLYITTNPQPSGLDGRVVVVELVWEKIK
jgi:lipocalin-like protein